MKRKLAFPMFVIVVISLLGTMPVLAESYSPNVPNLQTSNYCPACHSINDARLENATSWVGGIQHNLVSPCPAIDQINEELYYTERLMLAIDRAREQTPGMADLSKSESRLMTAGHNYSRLLDAPVTSLEAFTAEARMVRFSLGKVYTTLSQTIDHSRRNRVFWGAVGVSIVMVGSLIWGSINAQKALKAPHRMPKKGLSFYLSRGLILISIFGLFALPIFRVPSQAVLMPSLEAQERQAVLDQTERAAQTADRELSRAWSLARIGAFWFRNNQNRGEAALEKALAASKEAQNNLAALWGLSQRAWEAGVGEKDTMAEAALIADDLDAVRGRTWSLRLIAETWTEIDPAIAESILTSAFVQTEEAVYPYKQLDLRAIAVTWTKINPDKGVAVARKIVDPATRSWAFREIAIVTGDESYIDIAAQAAREVSDPVERARSLREIGAATGKKSFFNEAAETLRDIEGVSRAFAMADLAIASKLSELVEEIPLEFPAARALAYYGLGAYEDAWRASREISDRFERARAQAAIAGAWGNAEAADQISYPLLRDRALRDVSLKTGNLTLVDMIQDSYYQVQVLTAAGRYDEAWQKAEGLRDGYPLVALGSAWAGEDPKLAAQVIELLQREADKAVVLRYIAAETKQRDDFERALGMALAARVRGDALSPVQASLDLAEAFSGDQEKFTTALEQAMEAAQRINIIY